MRESPSDPSAFLDRVKGLDQAGRHSEALELLHGAAQGGDPTAMTMLGARLVRGAGAPYQPEAGARWLVRAGENGGAASRRLASALVAAGVGVPRDVEAALDGLLAAALLGDGSARGQLAALTSDEGLAAKLSGQGAVSANTLTRARRAVDTAAWTTPPPVEVIRDSPSVTVFRRFLSPVACAWIREAAGARLEQVAVKGADGGGDRSMDLRTASGAGFGVLNSDVVMALVRARTAAAAEIPVANFEPPNVLHYEPGQRYEPHFDFFNTAIPHLAQAVETGGQRVSTALIYLNDDYEGGETDFPELGFRFRGGTGDALIFSNVDAAGQGDPRTVHAGLPPTSGRKWLLSQWIRNRPQPLV
jgi:prolyl 4-hydroxylase